MWELYIEPNKCHIPDLNDAEYRGLCLFKHVPLISAMHVVGLCKAKILKISKSFCVKKYMGNYSGKKLARTVSDVKVTQISAFKPAVK